MRGRRPAAPTPGPSSRSTRSAASDTSRSDRRRSICGAAIARGNNLFGNTLLALDLRTGKRLWHYQLLHHDLWDYDLVTGPKLLTVTHNGKPVDIVAQATKFGLLYVFDRVTGKPIWPIEERPVPQSDVPGEQSSPTQPFPTRPAPFSRLEVHRSRCEPVSRRCGARSDHRHSAERRATKASSPRSASRRIRFPCPASWAARTGAAPPPIPKRACSTCARPTSRRYHTPLRPVEPSPAIDAMTPQPRYTGRLGSMFFAENGLNAMSPPWAQITAYDLNTGDIKWQAPFGVVPSLAAKGHHRHGEQLPRTPQWACRDGRRTDLHRALRRSHRSRVRQRQREDSLGEEDGRRTSPASQRCTK